MADEFKAIEEENAKLKALVEEKKKLVEELNSLSQREALGGKAQLAPPPAPKKEISDRDYAQAALRGRILR